MITHVNGDILSNNIYPNKAIVCNLINTFGAAGTGLTKRIYDRYYKNNHFSYFKICRESYVGFYYMDYIYANKLYLLNIFSKRLPEDEYDIAAIGYALKSAIADIKYEATIRIPYKMCGKHWDGILKIIKLFEDKADFEIWHAKGQEPAPIPKLEIPFIPVEKINDNIYIFPTNGNDKPVKIIFEGEKE